MGRAGPGVIMRTLPRSVALAYKGPAPSIMQARSHFSVAKIPWDGRRSPHLTDEETEAQQS